MYEEKKKYKNMGTYAIMLFLAVVLILIIAAMADNREEQYENQIQEQVQINSNIQNEIVSLKDENYRLKNEVEKLKEESLTQDIKIQHYYTLERAWYLYRLQQYKEAAEQLEKLEKDNLTEDQKISLQDLEKKLQAEVN